MKKYLFVVILILFSIGIFFLISNSSNHQMTIQSHRSYELDLKTNSKININEPTTIKYQLQTDRGEILKDYTIAHEKIMHLILIRKDLTQFQHLHPDFNQETGEFSIDLTFSESGPYKLFADFTPAQENPQKLAVVASNDLNVGDSSNYVPAKLIIDPNNQKIVSDYKISYNIPNNLKSNTELKYSLTIEQNNQPVVLENYLGALGHSIILKENTLDYIHTHVQNDKQPMQGHSSSKLKEPNKIDFSTTLPEPGIYKIFTQFQHQGNVITTDYIIKIN